MCKKSKTVASKKSTFKPYDTLVFIFIRSIISKNNLFFSLFLSIGILASALPLFANSDFCESLLDPRQRPSAPARILLDPILNQLNIYQHAMEGIPLRTAQDVTDIIEKKGRNPLARRVARSLNMYPPVEDFAVSPDGNLLALSWESRMGFLDENQLNQVFLIGVGSPKAKLVGTLNSEDPNYDRPASIVFITQDIIRVGRFKKEEAQKTEGLGWSAGGMDGGYHIKYELYDLSTRRVVDLNALIEPRLHGKIIHARAFSNRVYLIAYIRDRGDGQKQVQFRFVYIEPSSKPIESWKLSFPQMTRELSPDQWSYNMHSPVDERDVFKNSDGGAWIKFTFHEGGKWEHDYAQVSKSIVRFRREFKGDGTPVNGKPFLRADFDHPNGVLNIKSQMDGGSKSWVAPALEHVYSNPTWVENGFVAMQENHPHYAHLLLLPSGRIVMLAKERFIQSLIHPQCLYGLSFERGVSGELELHFIRIPF